MKKQFKIFFTIFLLLLATIILVSCNEKEQTLYKTSDAKYVQTQNKKSPDSGLGVIYPQESDEILHNPGMGWVLLEEPLYAGRTSVGWVGDFPEADNVSLSLSWAHVEPKEGEFNWKYMDEAIEYWQQCGKRINIRLVTDVNTIGYPCAGAPDWIGDNYPVEFKMEKISDSRRARSYDLANPIFLEKHDNFVKAFAEKYKNNPDIDVIEIRAYGIYGEWHSSGLFKTVESRIATLRHFLDVWERE